MIIEANSLADDLRGISMYERIAYPSIFILGILTIRTGKAFDDCQTNYIYEGVQWDLALVPLTLLGDVTKSYNISLLILGMCQTWLCQLRLQFLIMFLIYRMLGKHNLIYCLLYILPLLINQVLPYKKWIYIYVQFVLILLIIMVNKSLVQNKPQKNNYNLKYFASRLIVCIIMFQFLGINDEMISNNQLFLMSNLFNLNKSFKFTYYSHNVQIRTSNLLWGTIFNFLLHTRRVFVNKINFAGHIGRICQYVPFANSCQ